MLKRFGFTPTESKTYQALLNMGPSTGYAVARELGVARANIYQALESLARRGAARKSATVPIQYAATGPAALIAALERSFQRDIGALERSLAALPIAGGDSSTQLELLVTADQLLARAASCADAAVSELHAVTGPWAESVTRRIEAASGRRVQGRVVSLGEPSAAGAIVRHVPEAELRAYWGGLPVALVADRARAVFGLVLDGGAASGLATNAPGAVPFLRHLLRREHGGVG